MADGQKDWQRDRGETTSSGEAKMLNSSTLVLICITGTFKHIVHHWNLELEKDLCFSQTTPGMPHAHLTPHLGIGREGWCVCLYEGSFRRVWVTICGWHAHPIPPTSPHKHLHKKPFSFTPTCKFYTPLSPMPPPLALPIHLILPTSHKHTQHTNTPTTTQPPHRYSYQEQPVTHLPCLRYPHNPKALVKNVVKIVKA